jgi:pimeloyl-ACP methyl ester carboxylesterase
MRPFSDKELKALNMPILLLIGDNDIINNDKALAKAKKQLSNVSAKKIRKAGHFLSMDQADVVNEELINFMNGK